MNESFSFNTACWSANDCGGGRLASAQDFTVVRKGGSFFSSPPKIDGGHDGRSFPNTEIIGVPTGQ